MNINLTGQKLTSVTLATPLRMPGVDKYQTTFMAGATLQLLYIVEFGAVMISNLVGHRCVPMEHVLYYELSSVLMPLKPEEGDNALQPTK